MKKHHVIAFGLGWAFALIFPPSHVVGMFRSKQA